MVKYDQIKDIPADVEDLMGRIDRLAAQHGQQFLKDVIAALVEKYLTDITELGKRHLEMEFGELAKKPEIASALMEARKPRDLVAIRELLEKERTHVST